MVSWILPKNERKKNTLLLWYLKSNCFRMFFGRIEDTKMTFQNYQANVRLVGNSKSMYGFVNWKVWNAFLFAYLFYNRLVHLLNCGSYKPGLLISLVWMNVWCPANIGSHYSRCKKSLGGIHWISPKGSFGTNHLTKGTNNQKDQGSTSVSIKKTRKLSKKGRNRFLILSLKTECKFCCDSWDLKKIITVKKINVLFQNWDNFTILHFSLMRIKWICTQYN